MAADHHSPADLAMHYSVGDELRLRREAMGKSIADIVDAVRIQGRYLEALEDGRLEDLPGTVYALGFVRTYAEYLGLDGADVVARYKEETQGLKTQNYVMPEPLEEGKVPTAAILLGAIVLAAAAYAAWYFFSQPEGRVAQQVPEVPERLAGVTEVPAPAVVPPSSQAIVPAAPAPTDAPPASPPARAEGDAPPPAVAAPPPAPAPVETVTIAPAETPVAPPAEPTPSAEPPAPAPSAAPPTPPAPAPSAALQAPPAPAQPVAAPEAAAPTDLAAATPPVPDIAEAPREARVYGLANVDARIIIVAEEDAWVEVTDSDDARLFSRVLRKGDSYRAPNREGAKFVTGNAGGLRVMVDGVKVPALGPPGQVRRDIKLDPDLLKAGRAWP